MRLLCLLICTFVPFGIGQALAGVILEPAGDKHMYPFIQDMPPAGQRDYASVFGAYGALDNIPGYDFDDRDSQFFIDFDTTGLISPGEGAQNYHISSLEVWIVVQNNLAFTLDTSPDSLHSFQNIANDTDQGRPIEIYGVGYRGGFSRETFSQDSPFASGLGYKNGRNAYAIDFNSDGATRDVSNNVEEAFQPNPWAIADAPGSIDYQGNFVSSPVAAGSSVPEGTVLRFSINLADPQVRAYVQSGLHAGRLHLMVSSLYNAVQQGSDIPKFYTKESDFHDPTGGVYLAPRMYAEVTLATTGTPPTPAVSLLRPDSSTYRVSFETQAGYLYVVESRDSLGYGAWSPKTQPIAGNGQTQIFDDSEVSPAGRRFYRVAVTANTP